MAKKRKDSVNEGIQAENVSGQAIAVGKNAQATVNQTVDSGVTVDLQKAFEGINKKVEALPDGPDKEIAKSAVTALKDEAKKGDEAKEENVKKWLNFLLQSSPDIWDVAVASFTNPILGIGTAFKKVADRAKEEQEKEKGKEADKKKE